MTEKQLLNFFFNIYTHTEEQMSGLSEMWKCWSLLNSKSKGIAGDLNEDVTAGYASLNTDSEHYLQAVFVKSF